ncbi:hypothetical protein GWK47_032737 [Chionoecetes opilio]|uniref:C-type lectin domain-containing protein n=1 Tax=Chionoecetes opilio TaxID=41210 RepID=A0A8J4YQ23_CHIOP|nr:hypothetical protein GWK47_032737 [Chionoecetes opilio]
MQWCFVFAAVVAVVSGHRVSYDGTPLADNVVLIGGVNSGVTFPQGASPVVPTHKHVPRVAFPAVVFAAPHNFFPVPSQPQPVFPAPHGPLPCSFGAATLVHETSQSRREYHFSWCHHSGQTFTHAQAEHYCRSLPSDGHPVGFHLVSIEDYAEDSLISTIISAYRVPYIWTSGKKVSAYAWKWQTCVASLYNNWSRTGRSVTAWLK